MYRDFLINNTFTERVFIKCKASKEPMSNQFTFNLSKMTGSLIYLPNSYLPADLKVKYGDTNLMEPTQFNYLPNPLNTWASSVNLSVNGVNIGAANSFNVKTSYILNLFGISVQERKNLVGMNLGWLDTPL